MDEGRVRVSMGCLCVFVFPIRTVSLRSSSLIKIHTGTCTCIYVYSHCKSVTTLYVSFTRYRASVYDIDIAQCLTEFHTRLSCLFSNCCNTPLSTELGWPFDLRFHFFRRYTFKVLHGYSCKTLSDHMESGLL